MPRAPFGSCLSVPQRHSPSGPGDQTSSARRDLSSQVLPFSSGVRSLDFRARPPKRSTRPFRRSAPRRSLRLGHRGHSSEAAPSTAPSAQSGRGSPGSARHLQARRHLHVLSASHRGHRHQPRVVSLDSDHPGRRETSTFGGGGTSTTLPSPCPAQTFLLDQGSSVQLPQQPLISPRTPRESLIGILFQSL